jgi:GxxExxY protein
MTGILRGRIIQCIIAVHNELGPGYSEKIYRRAMMIELTKQNLQFEIEKHIPIYYAGRVVGRHRLDILVDNQVIMELKTVEALNKKHYAQVRSYLKATGLTSALLVNFSGFRADYRHISTTSIIPKKNDEDAEDED